jgi:single-stranded-DNA-specific exonuclease
MDALAEQGVELLITVDCGITNNSAIAHARSLGMEVVICDHHEPGEELPDATAILDHKRKDETSQIRSLCGSGVAFYLMMAVRAVLRERGRFADGQAEPDLRQWLDMVAVATIADMVPLVAENRILAVAGLEKLKRNPLVGLAELFRVAGADTATAGTYHVGFVVGPRINASGRLGSANPAMELLTTDDPLEAQELAAQLQTANIERRDLQEQVVEEALEQARSLLNADPNLAGLVLWEEHWHEGVIGIAAARVVEEFRRISTSISG